MGTNYQDHKGDPEFMKKRRAYGASHRNRVKARREIDPTFNVEYGERTKEHSKKANQRMYHTLSRRYFTRILREARQRAGQKDIEYSLDTPEILEQLYQKFLEGRCSVTGMILDASSPHLKPSLDRIDSNKGYTLENVRWVSWAYNRAKNVATDGEVAYFIKMFTKSLANGSEDANIAP